jgi:phage tail-like protein
VDVNGTRFHLVSGREDWQQGTAADSDAPVFWDTRDGVTLEPALFLFSEGTPLDLSRRRGAAADRFDNVYWIADDRRRIFWAPSGSRTPTVFWDQRPQECAPVDGEFSARVRPPADIELAGLAVTVDHYLVVGSRTDHGVLIFDLHAGGPPMRLLMPDPVFDPFDIAASPLGGVAILDASHAVYWLLDREFHILEIAGAEPALEESPAFGPRGGPAVTWHMADQHARGFDVAAVYPVSIEVLADGTVLILDSVALAATDVAAPSRILRYRLGSLVGPPVELVDVAREVAGATGALRRGISIVGYDFALDPSRMQLFVVSGDGNQAIAFPVAVDAPSGILVESATGFFPLHFFAGRGLISSLTRVLYDVAPAARTFEDDAVRWVGLHELDRARYVRLGIWQKRFDGKQRYCRWHRLFLDACIPSETSVRVLTRAADTEEDLDRQPFEAEPALYLRGTGPEIPYLPATHAGHLDPSGTWELLFQSARGRWLDVRLELAGNGRATPLVSKLRAYYPRFSYPERYLPAAYQDDAGSAALLERLLANPEGMLTEIDGRIDQVRTLFDPRSAPADGLDWLAGFFGLVMDPLWTRVQERRAATGSGISADRRRLLIRFGPWLFAWRGTLAGARLALTLVLDPCIESLLARLKRAAVEPDHGLAARLADEGRAYPRPSSIDSELEDALLDLLLSDTRPSRVRIVERFAGRGGRAVVAGDPTRGSSDDTLEAAAHRFVVLVPEGITADERSMVERVIDLEKPAHTAFDVRAYWDMTRVGEMRLGIDTLLGPSGRFVETRLGESYLAEGFIGGRPPADVADRIVMDRDGIGGFPPL